MQRDIGMTCGGWVKLFFEVFNRDDWHVVVFGAGHVSQALVKVLLTLSCRVTCVDPRPEWMGKITDDVRLKKICTDDMASVAADLSPQDYVICMTMGHSTDRPVLKAFFENVSDPVYVGAIGSKSKRGVLVRELKSDGIEESLVEQLICPIGLRIGSNQPAEIAISIAAQLVQHHGERKRV